MRFYFRITDDRKGIVVCLDDYDYFEISVIRGDGWRLLTKHDWQYVLYDLPV